MIMTAKTESNWKAERDAALATLDLETFKAFYKKWSWIYMNPLPNDEVAELAMYKACTACLSIPIEIRRKADAWLRARGSESFLHEDGRK